MKQGTVQPKNRTSQGMVSIIVTMVLMMVISLIVLGFAQASRQEQRQALDRDLSSQAIYAAESGINDAVQVIKKYGADQAETNQCNNGDNANYSAFSSTIDGSNSVSYTCLLVHKAGLTSLTQKLKNDGSSGVYTIQPGNGQLVTLHLAWDNSTTGNSLAQCPGGGSLPNTDNWNCPYGLLRLDFVPTDTVSRASMNAGQKTFFLKPTTSGSGLSLTNPGLKGTVNNMACAPNSCSADITMDPLVTNYAIRAMATYAGGNLTITGKNAAGDATVFNNAQIQIDATGKAQDVLRRMQVRIPLTPIGTQSNYAIASASSICKRFRVGNGVSFNIGGDLNVIDPANPMCTVISAP